ncbi:universal stress protein [Parafrigoribacterium humi]|uniref:universal stress protein n=1 Tax=Parafrigoribacterium humi TaxID=3144664 RepID=UPI0032EB5449
MSGTLVVGIDGTESSRAALRWAVTRAAATGVEVKLVHVIDDEWITISARMIKDLGDDSQRLLESEAGYARALAPNVIVHTESTRGEPMQVLIAESRDAGMIVVGTHKTGFINGKIFGSRSLQLAACAYAPVAIIPQGLPRDGRGIVAGVDDSIAGRQAIRFAAREAARTGETLTLVRAFTIPATSTISDDARSELIQHSEERASAALADAVTLATLTAPEIDLKTRTVRRPIGEVLVDAAATATMLVIGSSRQEETTAMVGSVSHDVLINLTGPAVVVHAGDAREGTEHGHVASM